MRVFNFILSLGILAGSAALADENMVELSASKDTFGRSNNRNGTSGGAPFLLLAPVPGITSIISFDLSSITNEIMGAEFSFRIQETNTEALSLTVASMVHNEKNGKWMEGAGNLGIRGQNAQIGESTFQWRAFRDRAWLDGDGRNARNLSDETLWRALTELPSVEWSAGSWIVIRIDDPAFLEEIRTHEMQTVTFGLWGTSGNGVYKVDSKESGQAAQLKLTVKPAEKAAEE